MTDDEIAKTDEATLRRLIDDRIQAIRAKDVAAAVSAHAPDVRSFDLIDPLRKTGREAIEKRLEQWFSQFREGPIGFEMRELELVVGGGAAFCHSLNHVDAVTRDGNRIDMWWRATTGFRKDGGRWLVVHEHSSVPFDMESLRASLDLKP